MPIVTAQDLVTFSLKAAGVLGVGQTPLAEDNTDAFSALNAMLSIWNRKRWLVYHLVDIALTSTGAQSYTVGPGGDFNVARPDRLEAAFFRQFVNSPGNNVDYPLEILEAREDYNEIALKSLMSWPTYIFYDSAFPLGSVYPWPIPQASTYELHLSLKETLTQFTTYTDPINLPGEYIEALWTNLALRLAPLYQIETTPGIQGLARSSLEAVRGANAQIGRLNMPSGLNNVRSKYNIFSDSSYN